MIVRPRDLYYHLAQGGNLMGSQTYSLCFNDYCYAHAHDSCFSSRARQASTTAWMRSGRRCRTDYHPSYQHSHLDLTAGDLDSFRGRVHEPFVVKLSHGSFELSQNHWRCHQRSAAVAGGSGGRIKAFVQDWVWEGGWWRWWWRFILRCL